MEVNIDKSEATVPGPQYPDLFDGESPILIPGEAVCIGCHCTDSHACHHQGEPCHWLVVNYEIGVGACSACPEYAGVIRAWEEVGRRRTRQGRCRRCGDRKSTFAVVSPVLGAIGLQYCWTCDDGVF